MKNKKEVDKERGLKQHSALTTFTTEQDYFNIDTEKALFSILADTQTELQRMFANIYKPYIKRLFNDEEIIEKLSKAMYVTNSVAKIEIDYSKINTKIIPEIKEEIIRKKIEAAHSALIDKSLKDKYLLEIEGLDVKQLALNKKENKIKIIYSREELVDLLDNIKDICKYETLNKYGRSKVIDFTVFVNKLGVNSKRLRENIDKASNVQLRFNYIDKKNINIEVISNLISSIAFMSKSKSTWMKYEIPEEILKRLLMPEMYVYLPEEKIHRLEGKYSIRLYTFLKDHVNLGTVTITKEECENFFKLPKTYMKIRTHFVNKFLNPTIADIQAKTNLLIDYELIPEYNFKKIKFNIKQGREVIIEPMNKEQNTLDALEIVEASLELQKVISKTKHNIYVARAWNKRMDTKIIKMIKEEGEEFTKEILKALYEGLNENVKTTLVQYVNGIIKNKKIQENYKEENKKQIIKKELDKEILILEKIELQEVISKEQEDLLNAYTEYKIEQTELQKVISDEEDEERLYDICVKENRLKTQGKFIVTNEEYLKEHKRYIAEGYTSFKATQIMNQIFIAKNKGE